MATRGAAAAGGMMAEAPLAKDTQAALNYLEAERRKRAPATPPVTGHTLPRQKKPKKPAATQTKPKKAARTAAPAKPPKPKAPNHGHLVQFSVLIPTEVVVALDKAAVDEARSRGAQVRYVLNRWARAEKAKAE